MPRILITAAVAAVCAMAVPSLALGATLHQEGRIPHRLLLQDDAGEVNLISVTGSKSVVIEDLNAPIEIAGVPTCMPIDERTVSCSAVRRLELDLGIGRDHARISTPHPVELDGGPGNDTYIAQATVPTSVNFAGGIGLDTVNYGPASAGVRVAVDLEAGDGRPGDDDVIRRDVEVVLGSPFDDVLSGSHRTLQLSGGDGDDLITGGSAEELLSGGPGQDRIEARDGALDTIACGGQLFDWAAVDFDGEASITGCAEVVS
jgi:hypothetical protein